MVATVPNVFAQLAAGNEPAALLDQNFAALVAAINAISVTTGITINAQTGTTYAVQASDFGKLITFTNAGSIAVSLPQAIGQFTAPFYFYALVPTAGVGSATILATGSTIDGSASFSLQSGEWGLVVSDGVNYQLVRSSKTFKQRPYTSPQQAITSAGTLTLAHLLTSVPLIVTVTLHCVTGEAGYTAGQEFDAGFFSYDGTVERGCSVLKDATNLTVRFASPANVYFVPHATTGVATALTNANWTVIFKAFA